MECKVCNETFERIGQHWNYYPHHSPVISTQQREIITGTLMGDAYIAVEGNNPRYILTNKKKEYIDHTRGKLGCIDSGTVQKDGDGVYRWKTVTHWGLRNYLYWYEGGKKEFPNDITLTPTILKHWYACDGTRENRGGVRIAMSNERRNKEKIEMYFSESGLPKPNYWLENKRSDYGGWRCRACWNKEESSILLDWMGDPLPGYEYKWQ